MTGRPTKDLRNSLGVRFVAPVPAGAAATVLAAVVDDMLTQRCRLEGNAKRFVCPSSFAVAQKCNVGPQGQQPPMLSTTAGEICVVLLLYSSRSRLSAHDHSSKIPPSQ
jgi:hypothetical protein